MQPLARHPYEVHGRWKTAKFDEYRALTKRGGPLIKGALNLMACACEARSLSAEGGNQVLTGFRVMGQPFFFGKTGLRVASILQWSVHLSTSRSARLPLYRPRFHSSCILKAQTRAGLTCANIWRFRRSYPLARTASTLDLSAAVIKGIALFSRQNVNALEMHMRLYWLAVSLPML